MKTKLKLKQAFAIFKRWIFLKGQTIAFKVYEIYFYVSYLFEIFWYQFHSFIQSGAMNSIAGSTIPYEFILIRLSRLSYAHELGECWWSWQHHGDCSSVGKWNGLAIASTRNARQRWHELLARSCSELSRLWAIEIDRLSTWGFYTFLWKPSKNSSSYSVQNVLQQIVSKIHRNWYLSNNQNKIIKISVFIQYFTSEINKFVTI